MIVFVFIAAFVTGMIVGENNAPKEKPVHHHCHEVHTERGCN